jgi:transcriptional regulator with XRE-family HTH domain
MDDGWFGPETIGALMGRARQELCLTQLGLAARLCAAAGTSTITRHEVSRWERGERIPSIFWVGWLAVALELPVDQLDRAAIHSRRLRQWEQGRPGRGIPPTWVRAAPGVYSRVA